MQALAENTGLQVALVVGWPLLCWAVGCVVLFIRRPPTYATIVAPVVLGLLGLLVIGHLSGMDMTGLLLPFAMLGVGMVFVARAWMKLDWSSNKGTKHR